jgi:hypothetical protein
VGIAIGIASDAAVDLALKAAQLAGRERQG